MFLVVSLNAGLSAMIDIMEKANTNPKALKKR